jgi:hypothetical protein
MSDMERPLLAQSGRLAMVANSLISGYETPSIEAAS